ncbi:MAG: PEP-CTERM sorting domain-containing protein [Pirellulales bacterium]|nr:PEP-CTERM sorting domain-containing protein [Pirellulales bacterium]
MADSRGGVRGALALALCGTALAACGPAGTLMWNFDQGDLSLTAAHDASATMTFFEFEADDDTFGVTGVSDIPPNMADGQAHYLYHGPLPNHGHGGFQIDHAGLAPTPGQEGITSWTMVFDVFVPEPPEGEENKAWNGMFNSSPTHANAAEWYLRPGGALGSSALYVTPLGTVSSGAWHRIGLVYDGLRSKVEYWVDGQEVFDGPIVADPAYALLPSSHAGADLVLQGDHANNSPPKNYTSDLYLASFAMADFACADYQMKMLGGAKAAGIFLPTSPLELGTESFALGPDELDLDGPMAYAVNVGGDRDVMLGGVTFRAEQSGVAGFTSTMQWAPPADGDWFAGFAPGPGVDELVDLLSSSAWRDVETNPPAEATITLDVAPGVDYKLQLLFWAPNGVRSFDVYVDDVEVLDEFRLAGGAGAARLFTYLITAESDSLEIRFEAGTDPSATSYNPVLNALSLEVVEALPDAPPGDANRDGRVDAADARILAAHWLQPTGAGWSDADFNADGLVDDLDLAILSANWSAVPAGAVPEPSSGALLLAALAMVSLRRRRRTSR